ncbi:MAG TPA: TolC family protein [Terriglobia bacterium]|nr:TolC family protein [Terriglobia bacterium]
MRKLLIFATSALLVSSARAASRPPKSPPPPQQTLPTPTASLLTLKQAEALALKNHPQVLAAQYQAQAGNEAVREQLSAYYPTVFGSVTGSVADNNTRIGAGFLTDSRLFNRFGQGITVDQLITDSGRTPNLVASSRLRSKAAQQNAQATRYDVLLAVDQAFFEVLRAQELLKVAQQTVNERQVVADQVSALVKNKLKSDLDLSFAQVNLAQARLLLITTQNNISKAFAQLNRALGSDTPQTYALQEEPPPPAPPLTSDPLVAEAMADRPELIALGFDRQAAYKFQKAERDLSFPTVEGMGVAGFIPEIDQITLPRAIPDHYEGAAINVDIPIFNGHLFAARRASAMLKARAADEDLRNEQERIARDVRDAWADSTTAYQQIGVSDQLMNQAKLALALAQGRYNLGLSSIVELNQAQLSETEAEIQDVNARYDYQIQNAALQYQIGSLR